MPEVEISPKDRWNELAKEYGLRKVVFWTPLREQRLRAMVRDFPSFWDDLEDGLEGRSEWARSRKFPTLDQMIITSEKFVRLCEGNYEDEAPQKRPLTELEDHRGRKYWGHKK
jgi:hypothetical protein